MGKMLAKLISRIDDLIAAQKSNTEAIERGNYIQKQMWNELQKLVVKD